MSCSFRPRARSYRAPSRLALVSALESLKNPTASAQARDAFIDAIAGLWDRLGEDAASFLEGADTLDRSHYAKAFDDRVAWDLELIADPEFRLRYLTGYELAQVPRFRTDVRGWRDFLGSMTRQLCLDHSRGRSQSWFLQAVRDALDEADGAVFALDESATLLKFLRTTWKYSKKRPGVLAKPAQMLAEYHLR